MNEGVQARRACERYGRVGHCDEVARGGAKCGSRKMRVRGLSDVWRLVWLLCLVLATSIAQTAQLCPAHGQITPCSCTVKKSGLDIVCESTDLTHISKAMAVLKGRPNTVIFYLRLRHNTLPKLQGYVFLGLDIRHLTIHNSSLAVLEEPSLSSIGKYI